MMEQLGHYLWLGGGGGGGTEEKHFVGQIF
jgi:hypothetical protein